MINTLPPAIFLMGPTASGKTGVAVELVQRLPVELISVDSALVFRDMDIGTAKPDAATLARVDAEPPARLAPADTQRIQRAMEIYRLTGQPMSVLFRQQTQHELPYD